MNRTASILAAASLLALGAAAACTSTSSSGKAPAHTAGQTVRAAVRILGKARAQISAATVIGVVGSYHTCAGQTDGASWVLDTPGNPGAMEAQNSGLSAPSVALDDTACTLQIDSINTSTTGYASAGQPFPLVFTGPGTTPGTYQVPATGFDDPTQSNALSFYANAQSTVTDASANFVLTIMVGDDASVGGSSTTAGIGGPLPASCADVLAGSPTADDGNYTLYVGGNVALPWTAYCFGMQSAEAGAPLEYVTLATGLQNYAQYTAGGNSPGTNVVTTYTRVRLDPTTLLIHGGDQRFASSAGSVVQGGVTTITSMPYAVAMSCDSTPDGTGSVDLTGTGFGVPPSEFSLGGSAPYGGANYVTDTDVTLAGGGFCGWLSGDSSASNPYNTADVTLGVFWAGLYDGGACAGETCSDLGFNCGNVGDGCGNVLDCGTCSGSATCGGGGVANMCGGGASLPCTGDLSGIGTGDFQISFTLQSTQEAKAALLNQRSSCGPGNFWDLRFQEVLIFETDALTDASPDDDNFEGCSTVNDGQAHGIVIQRIGGFLSIYVDGRLDINGPSTSSFGALPAFETGSDPCDGVDFTVPFDGAQGSITNVCVAPGTPSQLEDAGPGDCF